MQYTNLREQSIEDVLNQVQALQAMASEGQVRSVAAIAARCAIEVGDRVHELSSSISAAQEVFGTGLAELNSQLHRARAEMATASNEASNRTKALVRWTRVLAVATGAYVIMTGLLVLVTVLSQG